jgi:hypothetical protein
VLLATQLEVASETVWWWWQDLDSRVDHWRWKATCIYYVEDGNSLSKLNGLPVVREYGDVYGRRRLYHYIG